MPVRLQRAASSSPVEELPANAYRDPGDGYADTYSDDYGGNPPAELLAQALTTITLKAVKSG
jgi:hypothetical protein